MTEVGVLARVGAGAEFLLGYWAGSTALLALTVGAVAVIAVAIQIAQAAADVSVTVSATQIAVTSTGAVALLGLQDTPSSYANAARRLLRVNAAGDGIEFAPPGFQTLADAPDIAWNLDAEPNADVTLGANRTLSAPTGGVDGETYALTVVQDSAGSRTLAWPSSISWAPGLPGALPTGGGERAKFLFSREAGTLHGLLRYFDY